MKKFLFRTVICFLFFFFFLLPFSLSFSEINPYIFLLNGNVKYELKTNLICLFRLIQNRFSSNAIFNLSIWNHYKYNELEFFVYRISDCTMIKFGQLIISHYTIIDKKKKNFLCITSQAKSSANTADKKRS